MLNLSTAPVEYVVELEHFVNILLTYTPNLNLSTAPVEYVVELEHFGNILLTYTPNLKGGIT